MLCCTSIDPPCMAERMRNVRLWFRQASTLGWPRCTLTSIQPAIAGVDRSSLRLKVVQQNRTLLQKLYIYTKTDMPYMSADTQKDFPGNNKRRILVQQ